jgi:hypothetical protein
MTITGIFKSRHIQTKSIPGAELNEQNLNPLTSEGPDSESGESEDDDVPDDVVPNDYNAGDDYQETQQSDDRPISDLLPQRKRRFIDMFRSSAPSAPSSSQIKKRHAMYGRQCLYSGDPQSIPII